MIEENDWDHNVEGDAIRVPIDYVYRDDMVHALH